MTASNRLHRAHQMIANIIDDLAGTNTRYALQLHDCIVELQAIKGQMVTTHGKLEQLEIGLQNEAEGKPMLL